MNSWNYDRATAARLGLTLTSSAIDSTLYGAFGQAGSLAYLHAIEPVLRCDGDRAAIPADTGRLQFAIYFHTSTSGRSSARGILPQDHPGHYAVDRQSYRSVSRRSQSPSILRPGLSPERRCTREIDQLKQRLGHARNSPRFFSQEPWQAYQQSLSTEPYLILTALLAVYIVLGILVREPGAPAYHYFYACPRPASVRCSR